MTPDGLIHTGTIIPSKSGGSPGRLRACGAGPGLRWLGGPGTGLVPKPSSIAGTRRYQDLGSK